MAMNVTEIGRATLEGQVESLRIAGKIIDFLQNQASDVIDIITKVEEDLWDYDAEAVQDIIKKIKGQVRLVANEDGSVAFKSGPVAAVVMGTAQILNKIGENNLNGKEAITLLKAADVIKQYGPGKGVVVCLQRNVYAYQPTATTPVIAQQGEQVVGNEALTKRVKDLETEKKRLERERAEMNMKLQVAQQMTWS